MKLVWCLFFHLLLLPPPFCSQPTRTNTFYIAGLFPLNTDINLRARNTLGVYPRAAASYAVRQINQLGLLDAHNVTLSLEPLNSGCLGPASGAHGLIQALTFAMERGIHDTSGGEKNIH